MVGDNPYLAHLPAHMRGAGPSTPKSTQDHPLHGFLPRKVTAKQVQKALVRSLPLRRDGILTDTLSSVFQESDTNPFTNNPHSSQYKKILETRKKLPVYAQMEEFYKAVSPSYHVSGGISENWCQRAFLTLCVKLERVVCFLSNRCPTHLMHVILHAQRFPRIF